MQHRRPIARPSWARALLLVALIVLVLALFGLRPSIVQGLALANASDGAAEDSTGAPGYATYDYSELGYPELILVSAAHPLQERHPIEVSELAGLLPTTETSMPVDARIAGPLQELFAAAETQGARGFVIASGYRTRTEQQALYHTASDPAYVQPAGCSEHETGLAVDIDALDAESQDWLIQNAWRFGFILRYPADKEHLTGIAYEPWHFRYVGRDAARIITEQGICLEEYLEQSNHQDQGNRQNQGNQQNQSDH